ncbi:MAG: SHOCT domain-containing protein [Nitrosotalea sp.]
MSKSLAALTTFGFILALIGILYVIFGLIGGLGIDLVFGSILAVIGSTMFRMATTRMKKQKEQEENSPCYCMECDLQTNTRSEMLTHANTTGHRFTAGTKQPVNLSFNSMEILKSRYAKGEITKEQFEQMKKDLET